MEDFLQGATGMAALVSSAFFVKFWRETRDRLFGIFGLAFAAFALSRLLLVLIPSGSEHRVYIYLGRLAMYLLILYAIVDKNIRKD